MDTIRISLGFSSPAIRYTGFRCLHKGEGGYPNPEGMPIVRPSIYAPAIPFTAEMQIRSFQLNRHNPNFTGDKWRGVYARGTAFTNENGFHDSDPRADYVNNRDITNPPKLPKLMKAIICGGMFIRGTVIGNELICRPGIDAIDANKPIPTVEEILEKNWYFTATTGGENRVNNFPQGGGLPVLIPYFLIEPTPYPMIDNNGYTWFERWDREYLPNPLTIYNPR